MNKLGHTFGGLGMTALTLYVNHKLDLGFTTTDTLLVLAGVFIGSYLPDIDANESYIRNVLFIIAKPYTLMQRLVAGINPLNNIFKHRDTSH